MINVLIPVDGRHSTTTSEDYAVQLNKITPIRAVLLNVIDDSELDGHGLNPDFKEKVLETKRKLSEKAVAEASELFKKEDIEFERRIVTGNPGDMICRVAETEKFDLVIISESTFEEHRERYIGEISRKVLYNSRIPVLLVKHPH